MKYRHDETCELCQVLIGVMGRLERISRAEHRDFGGDVLAEAENAIATMQTEAKLAWVELRPLVADMKVERAPGDYPIGASARRADGWD